MTPARTTAGTFAHALAGLVALGLFASLALAASAAAPKPAFPSVATSPPDYSGFWRLDTAKSDMGKRLPRSREDQMAEEGVWLRVRSTTIRASGDTVQLDYRYRTDGNAVNRVLGQDVRTNGRRIGRSLRFDSETQLALFKFTVTEQWSLSPDGGTLTQDRTSRSPMGNEKQRLVFRRAK